METVGVRDLANRASAVLDELEQGGQPIIITRRGHPIAVLSAIDAEEFYDYVLAHSRSSWPAARPPRSASPAVSTGSRSMT